MVALAKVESQAEQSFEYFQYAMDVMTIDGDKHGYYCEMPSEEDANVRYKVRFVEPRGEVPYATGCPCPSRKFHPCDLCKHMEIVDAYYQMIYGLMVLPIYDASSWEHVTMDGDMSVQEHLIEEEMTCYHKDLLYEASHGVSHLRMRAKEAGLTGLSRAGKDQLIGSLMAWRPHTLVTAMSPECPQGAYKVPSKELTRGEIVAVLRGCLSILLSVCDGARDNDGQGCNGADAGHLRWLYRKQEWKADEVLDVAERLQKYNHTQLDGRVPVLALIRKVFAESASLNGNRAFSILR